MRILLSTTLGLLLTTPVYLLSHRGDGEATDPPALDFQDPGGREVCATGCSAVPALDESLSVGELERLLSDFAAQPMSGESEALETLLFHGASALALLDARGCELDAEREAFLRAELAYTHALLDVRIVDELGVERLHLGETSVPFGKKQHLHPHETNSLQTPEVSGTVHRVGLKHLWARL